MVAVLQLRNNKFTFLSFPGIYFPLPFTGKQGTILWH